MQLIRFTPEYQDDIISLHRSAINGFVIGIEQDDEEADLRNIPNVYPGSGGEFLIGLIDGELIAMGGFRVISGTRAELCRMRIKRDFQGQGYGSLLLKELERVAINCGITDFSFETAKARPLTLEFYRKHGYRETGTGFYGEVETVHFSKTLG